MPFAVIDKQNVKNGLFREAVKGLFLGSFWGWSVGSKEAQAKNDNRTWALGRVYAYKDYKIRDFREN